MPEIPRFVVMIQQSFIHACRQSNQSHDLPSSLHPLIPLRHLLFKRVNLPLQLSPLVHQHLSLPFQRSDLLCWINRPELLDSLYSLVSDPDPPSDETYSRYSASG